MPNYRQLAAEVLEQKFTTLIIERLCYEYQSVTVIDSRALLHDG